MKNLAKMIIISSFGVVALSNAQNYGHEQAPQGRPYPYEMGNPNYPSQPGYGVQPQYPQGQPQYRDNRGMMRGYDQGDAQRGTYQDSKTYKQSDKSSWTSWMGGDDKTPAVPDDAITSMVMQNLMSTPYLSNTSRNMQVTTKDGKVTLKGRAMNKNEKNLIEAIVKNVQGVKSVSNDLETEK